MKAPVSGGKTSTPQSEYIPAGRTVGIVSKIIDLGTHLKKSKEFGDKMKRQIRIEFELPQIKRVFNEEKGEQTAMYGKDYVFSMHEKAALASLCSEIMWKTVEEDFDIDTMIWKYCIIKFEHTKSGDDTRVNIFSISDMDDEETEKAIAKGIVAENPQVVFSLDAFDQKKYESLPERLQKKIALSPEYTKSIEDLPF